MILGYYRESITCPKGHKFQKDRRCSSAGRTVRTHCPKCDVFYPILAGPVNGALTERSVKAIGKKPAKPSRESQIEARLVKRVGELGGEVRKVQWVGRRSAPDRLVMLPERVDPENPWIIAERGRTIWVELKAPGGAATFPKNAHEKAQHREHERMRQMGQRVVVVDSYEQIEELLK